MLKISEAETLIKKSTNGTLKIIGILKSILQFYAVFVNDLPAFLPKNNQKILKRTNPYDKSARN